jgi:FAD-dependent oxidoreductase domain-containing protein 1
LETKFDVAVVGAGIMGVASAYHIKKRNPEKSVIVLERLGGPGQANTGRSNGMFRNTFSSSDNQLLADSSISFYMHVQEGLKRDIGLRMTGYLWLMSDRQLSESEPFLERMGRNGIETRLYDRGELERLLPWMKAEMDSEEASLMELPSVDGGIFGPKCGRLDPDKLVKFYADEFTEMGGKIALNTSVERVQVGPKKRLGIDGEPFVWQDYEVEGLEVRGGLEGKVRADAVVIACGAWNNELLEPIGIDGHVKAKKRQLFSVYAKGGRMEGLAHTRGFNALGVLPLTILPKSGIHFKPVVEEKEFWVACEDEINRPYIDVPERDISVYRAEPDYYQRGILPVLSAYFPDFRDAPVKAMWAGLYSYSTSDFLPIVEKTKNLIVVGGDSGSGIMKADALGRVVETVYRGEEEAVLYGGIRYRVSRLGVEKRDVERETWVI